MTSCDKNENSNNINIVLPNTKIIGSSAKNCSQLWQNIHTNGIYPKQLTVDLDNNSISGMVALYDKSISIDDLKAAIDNHYSKWTSASNSTSPVKLWRVVPDKFAIQLSAADDGMKRIAYLPFR
jgi:hypothetical protein